MSKEKIALSAGLLQKNRAAQKGRLYVTMKATY